MKNVEIHPMYGFTAQNANLISSRKKEPGWMLKKRLLAYKYYCSKKFPENHPELTKIDPQTLKIYLAARGKPLPGPEERRVSGYLLQAESTVQKIYLNERSRIKHVQFSSIDDGRKSHEEIFRKYFDGFPSLDDWIFSDMNLTCFANGTFLYVPKNVKCDSPFIILSKIFSRGLSQFKRNLFICDEESECHVVFRGEAEPWDDAPNLSIETTEIIVERGATCTLLINQKWLNNVWNFHTVRCKVQEGANFEIRLENSDAKISMTDLAIYLKGAHATCSVKSNSSGKNNENWDDTFKIFHENSKTVSRLDLLSFSKDSGVIRKRIDISISPNAAHSVSDINCLSMVFGPKSQIEILEKCAVQNTTSTINKIVQYISLSQEQINYLQTRGMDTIRIENLMIETAKKKLIW